MIFSSTVPTNVRNSVDIAEYLAGRFTYHNAVEWAGIIRDGRVFINGARCGDGDSVTGKDTISYDPGDFEEPDADLSYTIIYEDDWILGVNKPGNLLVHRAGRSFRNNLAYLLRSDPKRPLPDCHPAHRLDRDTSGVVLVAKNSEQKAVFGKLFSDGAVTKTYKAVVAGCPDIRLPFVIDGPISEDKNSGLPFKFKVDKDGKAATTVITGVQRFDNGLSMLTVRPVTGRTHQIRVHLATIGFPIVGDRLYNDKSDIADVSTPRRQALHCESLSFIHPHTNRHCEIKAELPDDIKSNNNNNMKGTRPNA